MSTPEDLVNWYLRLNGFMTIPNYILHPDRPGSQRTDTDVVGLRFPFRREFPGSDVDDPRLTVGLIKPSLVIVEVKTGAMKLNDAWIDPTKQNVEKLLECVGVFKTQSGIDEAAGHLYQTGRYENDELICSFVLVGNYDSGSCSDTFRVPRLTWRHLNDFIYARFARFKRLKRQNDQWDYLGKALFSYATGRANKADFDSNVRQLCGLPAAEQPLAPDRPKTGSG